jgi:outer membrane lipoprotein-sorting protein
VRLIRTVAVVLLVGACSQVWTELRAAEVADGQLSMPGYHARYIERGTLPDRPQVAIVRDITFQKPGLLRVETIAPADRKGDLYIYDGKAATYWWPTELVGIRIRGIRMADEKEFRDHTKYLVAAALRDYAWSLTGNEKIAGHETQHWKVLPIAKGPYFMNFEEWRHPEYQFPLKLEIVDAAGKPWYGMEFTKLEFNTKAGTDAFSFDFPPNALVFDWNLDDEPIALEEARKTMNFTVREPGALPEGHKLNRIVRARGQIPMLAMLMDKGAARLSLTQNRYAGRGDYKLPVGKRVQIGKASGYANFFAGTTTLNWTIDGTELTLVGNLPFNEMLTVAAGVK